MNTKYFVRHFARRILAVANFPVVAMVFPVVALLLVALASSIVSQAQSLPGQKIWTPAGPDGGNARSFASDPRNPQHLYMGTINSWVYQSLDGGINWERLSKVDQSDDLIVDNVLVDASDSNTIYAAVWLLNSSEGGLYVSHDAGLHWAIDPSLAHQSIRSFAQAPSDPKILMAGTLTGVFRSSNSGHSWELISPPSSVEIHEVESLAIDPLNPDIVYAGTWHLPWKTTDGGKNWHNIKQGVIDDSDVFSIIIDPNRPSVVYASACSGIYKSVNGGELFRKIQGIPSTARRTRVLMQDPLHGEIVYAGTTEGLYRTADAGQNWTRMTGPDVIVNDVYVDPRNPEHLLLATDRSGVLSSIDGSKSFAASNQGFSGRKVEALLVDQNDPRHLMAGVVNDKTYGGAFASHDGGATWDHVAQGLDGRDVYTLAQSEDGTILAGTSHGIFAYDVASSSWSARNQIINQGMKTVTTTRRVKSGGKSKSATKVVKETHEEPISLPAEQLDTRIYALDLSTDTWTAATALGLFTSRDAGKSWQGGPVLGIQPYISVTSHGTQIAAARRDSLSISGNAGKDWSVASVPTQITSIRRVAFSGDGQLWLAAREGIYFSKDAGKSWLWLEHIPFRDAYDIAWDAHSGRVLVSSRTSDQIYAIKPDSLTWDYWATGFRIFTVRQAGSRVIAASLYDGVLMQPESHLSASAGH